MDDDRPLVLVTGASSGIGYALAEQFAEHGYDLLINAEDDRLDQAAYRLRETGAEVRAVRADLRDPAGVDRLVAATIGLDIDVAVLNAGVGQGGAFADTDLTDDLTVIALNVTSTVRLAKPLLRDMLDRGTGRLAFTSSTAGLRGDHARPPEEGDRFPENQGTGPGEQGPPRQGQGRPAPLHGGAGRGRGRRGAVLRRHPAGPSTACGVFESAVTRRLLAAGGRSDERVMSLAGNSDACPRLIREL